MPDVTREHGLHDQPLQGAEKEERGGPGREGGGHFPAGLALVDAGAQAVQVLVKQLLRDALGRGVFGALQLTKENARHSGVFDHKVDVSCEHRLQGGQGRAVLARGLFDPRQQPLPHPGHDRLPEVGFGGKVAKQGSLGQVHLPGDGSGGDLAGMLRFRQGQDRLDGHGPSLLGRQIFGRALHAVPG